MSNSSVASVCFPCRKHRSIEHYPPPSRKRTEPEKCPSCARALHAIGDKFAVPKHDDVKGWARLYDQVTAPGYGRWARAIDEDRDTENQHWEQCRIRLHAGKGKKCERCANVEKRIPDRGGSGGPPLSSGWVPRWAIVWPKPYAWWNMR